MNSPANITKLEPDEVFVFGANEAGIHGAGAARQALRWGAKYCHHGRMGQTYGIPTKDRHVRTLPLSSIADHVAIFLQHAKAHPETKFLVTEVGCGLAGYKPHQIAPMFSGHSANVLLPQSFTTTPQ